MTDDEARCVAAAITAIVQRRVSERWIVLPPRDRVLEVARYLVDERAQDMVETTGRNDGVPNWLFCDGEGDLGEKPAYCAAGCLWCFDMAGCPIPGNKWKQRACRTMLDGFVLRGQFIARPSLPVRGDVQFYFGRRSSDPLADRTQCHHVGIVEVVDEAANDITTIEFNVSNRADRRHTRIDHPSIIGWGRLFE